MKTVKTYKTPENMNYWVMPGIDSIRVSLSRILYIISEYYEIDVDRIREKTRKREIVQCRQIFYYLSSRLTKETTTTIAKYATDKDWTGNHANCIHGINKVKDYMTIDKTYKAEVEQIKELIIG